MDVTLDGLKIALSTFEMLSAAVWDHRREHKGRYPRMLVVHPWVYCDLVVELTDTNRLHTYMQDMGESKDPKFMGVIILRDEQAIRPKLVDVNNEVIYI